MTKEEIEACSTPVEAFVVKPKEQQHIEVTTKILATLVKIVLKEAARDHPYAALKVLLKGLSLRRPYSPLYRPPAGGWRAQKDRQPQAVIFPFPCSSYSSALSYHAII